MIIFGTTSLNSTIDSGTFFCPRCSAQQHYRMIGVNRWFTLYFIPVIPMGRAGLPGDWGDAYLYLATLTLSGFVIGRTLDVNGGQYLN